MATSRLLPAGLVPQAESIERLVTLVNGLANGQVPSSVPGFETRRDTSYYLAAASILGLLDEDAQPTDLGGSLSALDAEGQRKVLLRAFEQSAIGVAWVGWNECDDLRAVDPNSAFAFLRAASELGETTARRRSSTLRAWWRQLVDALPTGASESTLGILPGALPSNGRTARKRGGAKAPAKGDATSRPADVSAPHASRNTGQLSLFRPPTPKPIKEETLLDWPDVDRFPHNEGNRSVKERLWLDLELAKDVALLTGYSSLDLLVEFLSTRRDDRERIRVFLGHEPFATRRTEFPAKGGPIADEIATYWLEKGFSLRLMGSLIRALEVLKRPACEVKTSRDATRPVHAKVYVTEDVAMLGSSNFSKSGLALQVEANARFEAEDRGSYDQVRAFVENVWTRGVDYKAELVELLERLLKLVSWQEALARACAALLEGEWATKYVAPEWGTIERPLWPHQVQGIAQALWILDNSGSVLIADATGSGKTTLGAWLLRAVENRMVRRQASRAWRLGSADVFPRHPVLVCPPAVIDSWQSASTATGMNVRAYSHGALSNDVSSDHEDVLGAIEKCNVLAVDEAHNFLNRYSSRTKLLLTHLADHVLLFTATPINRGASDILAIAELLGTDNLDETSLKVIEDLLRQRNRPTPYSEREVAQLKAELQRFTVRRTKRQLNRIVDACPGAYERDRRVARYPRHVATMYACDGTPKDRKHAAAIRTFAQQLSGIGRFGDEIRFPDGLGTIMTPQQYVDSLLRSAPALARHHVMATLRSSRIALFEHVFGTIKAVEKFGLKKEVGKASTGNVVEHLREIKGRLPKVYPRTVNLPEWLTDRRAHVRKCEEEIDIYQSIGNRLPTEMTSAREDRKVDLLSGLLDDHDLVIAFDSHLLTLAYVREELLDRCREKGAELLLVTGQDGRQGKRAASSMLGLDSKRRGIVLCSDALSEGLNLQKASCVLHLDMPTVIRVAEQRTGRIDRLDSPHDEIRVMWPQDPVEFAPKGDEILVERSEFVAEVLGANLVLPHSATKDESFVSPEELIREIKRREDEAEDALLDAFAPVKSFVSGERALIEEAVYQQIRGTDVDLVSCVGLVRTRKPWAFMAVGGIDRDAPRWVFFGSDRADPETDLSKISSALRERLSEGVESVPLDASADQALSAFLTLLESKEPMLLPVRKRKALALASDVLSRYAEDARVSDDMDRARVAEAVVGWIDRRDQGERPDLAEIADRWLRLILPEKRAYLNERRYKRSPDLRMGRTS